MIFNEFLVRQAKVSEFKEIQYLIKQSVDTAKYQNINKVDYAVQLRKQESYIPSLELVAEREGKLLGHVMFSKAEVIANNGNKYETLFLDPISIRHDGLEFGVCKALLNNSSQLAADMGYKSMFVYGDLKVFHDFGFRPANLWNICNDKMDCKLILAKELRANALSQISGQLCI